MSASAKPCEAFRVLIVERQEVMSDVERRVLSMVWIAEGGGAAMQVYIVVFVMGSEEGVGFGSDLVARGVSARRHSSVIPEPTSIKERMDRTASMTRLQHIQRSSHVPFTQRDEAVNGIRLDIHFLLLDNLVD